MHKCLLSPVLIALINTMLILPSAGRQGVRFGILLPELVMRLPGEQGSHTREGNRQEGQGSPNRGNRLQVSDIFLSLKQQGKTN